MLLAAAVTASECERDRASTNHNCTVMQGNPSKQCNRKAKEGSHYCWQVGSQPSDEPAWKPGDTGRRASLRVPSLPFWKRGGLARGHLAPPASLTRTQGRHLSALCRPCRSTRRVTASDGVCDWAPQASSCWNRTMAWTARVAACTAPGSPAIHLNASAGRAGLCTV